MPQSAAADPQLAFIFRRPFDEQVAFFRGKLGNLVPTERWDDIWKSAHDRAFMVAGAAKADLLADLAGAVDQAIAEGETLDAFRKRFAAIVEKHGWHGWTGEETEAGRAWRTRIIYQTNLSTSYAAGRLAQLKDAGFKYWVYRHTPNEHPRMQHLAWDGLTLPADHPFWQTHFAPNGWGCKCRISGASGPETAKLAGGKPGYTEPPAGWDAIDPKTGEPVGIDKGWGYMPGDTSADDVARAVAKKTVAWPYETAKAYMGGIPANTRDALAAAIRSQPETGEAARRYAERALGVRNGAPIEVAHVEPYQTLGLLTSDEMKRAGVEGLYDWALAADDVRHALRRHGDPATEARLGQVAVTTDDFGLAPIALRDGQWHLDGQTDIGRPAIVNEYTNPQTGVRYLMVWEVRSGRRMIVLKSMRKWPAPGAPRP